MCCLWCFERIFLAISARRKPLHESDGSRILQHRHASCVLTPPVAPSSPMAR
jgi:hypothetical protein